MPQTADLRTKIYNLKTIYWPLTKSLQTTLLLTTGIAGYMSARCPVIHWTALVELAGSLYLAISGSTMLNMWYDRDIDVKMERTCNRPLSLGKISPQEVFRLGMTLSVLGIAWALALAPLYGAVVFAGWFFDVLVYTIWLKRRTHWSIIWGGIAGGMPVLAGRVMGLGYIDWIGVALSLAVFFWIPTHILTFSMRHHNDYQSACIPTIPAQYGFAITHFAISLSSVLATLAMGIAVVGIGVMEGFLQLMGLLSGVLLLLAAYSLLHPSDKSNYILFKFASLYMLLSMFLIVLAVI